MGLNLKKRGYIGVLLGLMLWLPPAQLFGQESKEVRIGLMAALSGDFTSIGYSCRDGYEIARRLYAPRDRTGSYRLRFIYADSQGVGRGAISEFRKLVEVDGVWAVIGHRSQALMPLNPLSRQAGVLLLGVLGQAEFVEQNPYAFRFWPSTVLEGKALVKHLLLLKRRRIAMVSVEDEYALSLREAVKQAVGAGGGEVVFDETLGPDEREFMSVIARMRHAGADSVFVNLGIDQIGLFVRRLREQGLQPRLFSNFWIVDPKNPGIAGKEAIEGTLFVQAGFDNPGFVEAAKSYRADIETNSATYCCFSAAAALLQVLGDTPVIDGRASLIRAFSSLEQVRLPDETLELRGRSAHYSLQARVFSEGRPVPFKAAAN